MLQDNLIFCTALFRRADWELAGGYDPGMVYGWEDYDFWLSLIERGREVYRIPEYLFSYRVASDSMVRSKEKWQKVAMCKRIFERHQELFRQHIEVWIDKLLSCRESYLTSRLYIDTGTGISDGSSIGRKIEQGTGVIDFQTTDFLDIQALRFDPVDTYTVVKVEKIILNCTSGAEEFPLMELTGNSCLREENIFYFDTPDPQIFFSCDPGRLAGLRQVTVFLRFLAFDAEALRLLSDRQQEQLRCLQMENTALKKAGLFRNVGRFLPNFRISD